MKEKRVLISFKLKNPDMIPGLERTLGHGQGVRIEFRDRPALPIDWDPPLVFYVNGTDVGFLSGDTLKIDVHHLQTRERNVYEKIMGIAAPVPQEVNM